jgi:NADH-quinone oxidoreductase subunit C
VAGGGMDDGTTAVLNALKGRFGDLDWTPKSLVDRGKAESRFAGPWGREQLYVSVPADRLLEVAGFLREDGSCAYEQLCDLTCVDYLNFPGSPRDRYGVIYSLLSLSRNHRLWVKCFVNDPDPEVPSVTGIWRGAEWMERELWDMFGIKFAGHPDLRRILTWDGFKAHPLRKDYPLRGRGEREDYDVLTRESR